MAKKKGFTKMDNGFLEALYSGEMDLSCCDMRILLYILRYTVGFQKRSLSVSAKEIAKETNMTQRQAERVLAKLCGCGFLKVTNLKGKANAYEIDESEMIHTTCYDKNVGGVPSYMSDVYRQECRTHTDAEVGCVPTWGSEDTIYKEKERNVCKESGTHTPAFFSALWDEYPQKIGKGKLTAEDFAQLNRYSYSELHRAIERYKRDKEANGIDYWQNGSTFFKTGYVDYLDKNYTGEPLEEETVSYDCDGEVFEK